MVPKDLLPSGPLAGTISFRRSGKPTVRQLRHAQPLTWYEVELPAHQGTAPDAAYTWKVFVPHPSASQPPEGELPQRGKRGHSGVSPKGRLWGVRRTAGLSLRDSAHTVAAIRIPRPQNHVCSANKSCRKANGRSRTDTRGRVSLRFLPHRPLMP